MTLLLWKDLKENGTHINHWLRALLILPGDWYTAITRQLVHFCLPNYMPGNWISFDEGFESLCTGSHDPKVMGIIT